MKRKTPFVILGLLSDEDLTGYQIQKHIQNRFTFFWNESYGQLYPELKSLVQKGWIEAKPQDSPRKTILYSILPKGLKALEEWLKEKPEKESTRLEILLKVYFSTHLEPAILKEHIQGFMKDHLDELTLLNHFKTELTPIKHLDNHQAILDVIEFGIQTNQAYIQWCQTQLNKEN